MKHHPLALQVLPPGLERLGSPEISDDSPIACRILTASSIVDGDSSILQGKSVFSPLRTDYRNEQK
jgi:hypothetical protein